MPTAYTKPHLSVPDQVQLLESRGLVVSDPAAAGRWLGVVGYYRLSGYWYPYRAPGPGGTGRSDEFVAGTTFEEVIDLYTFDRRLKLHVLDALERVEIAVRFRVGHTLGRRSPYAHLDPDHLDRSFGQSAAYTTWRLKVDAAQAGSREDFVDHFRTRYDGRLPVWVVTEVLDFGSLSHLYAGLRRRDRDRDEIAHDLAVTDSVGRGNGAALVNWLRVLNYLRNTCAHHSRLWNRNLTVQLASRHLTAIAALRQVGAGGVATTSRPAGVLAVLAYLMNEVAPGSSWAADLTTLIGVGLPPCHRRPQEMGFPPKWESLSPTGAFTSTPATADLSELVDEGGPAR